MTRRLSRAVVAVLVLYWLGIFVASHLPPGAPPSVHVNDKIQHMGAYLVLTVLLSIVLGEKARSRGDWLVILIVLIYGAADEALQPLVNRQADLLDWFADATGAAVGVCLCGIARLSYSRLARHPAPAEALQEPAM